MVDRGDQIVFGRLQTFHTISIDPCRHSAADDRAASALALHLTDQNRFAFLVCFNAAIPVAHVEHFAHTHHGVDHPLHLIIEFDALFF